MKYVCKVIDVNPEDRVLTAVNYDNKIFHSVAILKNGQTVPEVGDLVIIDEAISNSQIPIYICIGTLEFRANSEQKDVSNPGVSFSADSMPSYEKDWHHHNPLFNSTIGTFGSITVISNDIIRIILDSVARSIGLTTGEFKIKTDNFEIQVDDTSAGSSVFRMTGVIEEGLKENNFILEINPRHPSDILSLKIVSAQQGDTVSLVLQKNGALIFNNKSNVNINTGSFIASVANMALSISHDLNIDVERINIKASSLVLSIMSSVSMAVLGKVSLSSQDSINMSAPEINIDASGDVLTATPMSKKVIIKSSNGSILLMTPLLDNPAANSGIFMATGFPEEVARNAFSAMKGIKMFSSTPGGIVIGGPFPIPVGINSFVKFNEFAILMTALIGGISAFATAQAAVATNSFPLLAPGYAALAAAAASMLPLVLACRSFYTMTGEP